MSEISPLTINAYLETDYHVFCEPSIKLKVDIANDSLAKLFLRFNTNCGVFITAYNPFSSVVSDAVNTIRQAELADEIKRHNLNYFEGLGKHPSAGWVEEPSYFVLGISLEAAKDMGNKYDQNAIVWCGPDTIPELVLLR